MYPSTLSTWANSLFVLLTTSSLLPEASLRACMEESKSTYINDLVCNFKNDKSKVFKYMRSLMSADSLPAVMTYNSTSASTNIDKAILFNKYFPSVFTSSEFSLPPLDEIQLPEETMSDVRFSEEEVFAALQNLDPNKAMGIDGIHQRVLKYCSVSLYKPIHNLFSLCTSSNRLPSEWKVHRITPVFKSGDRVLISNYRPISLLCSVSKVLERLIYDKISSFTLAQVTNNQFGFMPNHSCLQQLLVFVDSVVRCQERKSQLDVVYVDIRKAFDSVPHGELLYKLRKFGIVGNLWYLFRDYLTCRVQCVAIENELSHLAPVASGVPQGSILGPLFFLLYINDMPLAMPMLRAFMFADDTKLAKEVTSLEDCAELQMSLESLRDWSAKWKLDFNISKCCSLQFSSRSKLIPSNYSMNDVPLPEKNHMKDLGVTICDDLTWSDHHNDICAKAYRQLGLLKRTFGRSSSAQALKVLYFTLVRSKLTYCSQLWRPQLVYEIMALERVQRRATKFILQTTALDYRERLINLNILPLMMVYELADIMFFLKELKNPSNRFNITNYVTFSSTGTRSSTNKKLVPTRMVTSRLGHFYFNRLPRLWNALPPLNLDSSIPSLRGKLRKHFWNYFIDHFRSDDHCTFHFLCPCHKCTSAPNSSNFTLL